MGQGSCSKKNTDDVVKVTELPKVDQMAKAENWKRGGNCSPVTGPV
jgi:hypothetical protein